VPVDDPNTTISVGDPNLSILVSNSLVISSLSNKNGSSDLLYPGMTVTIRLPNSDDAEIANYLALLEAGSERPSLGEVLVYDSVLATKIRGVLDPFGQRQLVGFNESMTPGDIVLYFRPLERSWTFEEGMVMVRSLDSFNQWADQFDQASAFGNTLPLTERQNSVSLGEFFDIQELIYRGLTDPLTDYVLSEGVATVAGLRLILEDLEDANQDGVKTEILNDFSLTGNSELVVFNLKLTGTNTFIHKWNFSL